MTSPVFPCFPVCKKCREAGGCATPTLYAAPVVKKRKPETMTTAGTVDLRCGCNVVDFGLVVRAGGIDPDVFCPKCQLWSKFKRKAKKRIKKTEVPGQLTIPPF